jgi:hypothetical protein
MPINFAQQQQNLIDILEQYLDSRSEAAAELADWYDQMAKSGGDLLYQNAVLQAQKPLFERTLNQVFNTGINAGQAYYAQVALQYQQAAIQYWTGATLQLQNPPPGATQVVSNVITVPGVVTPGIAFEPIDNIEDFASKFVDMFKTHFQTIQGVTTALVPSPGGPVPTPFPWTGYS